MATRNGVEPELTPTREELRHIFRVKHGDPNAAGSSPRMRWNADYFTPDDHYEALVNHLVGPETVWLDAGCGRFLFPDNEPLSRELADRCRCLVGVDADETLDENPYVHDRVRGFIEDCPADRAYDLVTLRMVAEHVQKPELVAARLRELTRPGGHVVIYTIYKWSPIPVVTTVVPFALHHPVKRVLWGTESKDTFPVANKMNTRAALTDLFDRHDFDLACFEYVDDCRTLARFEPLERLELGLRKQLGRLGLRYPEVCILGAFRRRGSEASDT